MEEADTVTEYDGVGEELVLAVALALSEPDALALAEVLSVARDVTVGETAAVIEEDGGSTLTEALADALADALGESDCVGDGERKSTLALGEREAEAAGVSTPAIDTDALVEAVALPVADRDLADGVELLV